MRSLRITCFPRTAILSSSTTPPARTWQRMWSMSSDTHWFGGMVIVADGYHEASSLCLKHIWDVCAQRLEDDLAIMVPSKDMVVFVAAGDEVKLQRLIEFGNEAYERSQDRVSRNLLLFTREGKELLAYDKVQH